MPSWLAYLASSLIVSTSFMPLYAISASEVEPAILLEKMELVYDKVQDYQATIEVTTSKSDGSFDTKEFLYSFKKPRMIRLDFGPPYPGMIIVYPDRNGKVVVRPAPLLPFFKLHLELDNRLLASPSGQQIDQTDLGLLVRNIGHSLTDHRKGPVELTETDGTIEIEVLADDHFRQGVLTIYRFTIDKHLWLPLKVEEFDAAGRLERTVTFSNLRINIGIQKSIFRLDGD